jgi:hypothetical protein
MPRNTVSTHESRAATNSHFLGELYFRRAGGCVGGGGKREPEADEMAGPPARVASHIQTTCNVRILVSDKTLTFTLFTVPLS